MDNSLFEIHRMPRMYNDGKPVRQILTGSRVWSKHYGAEGDCIGLFYDANFHCVRYSVRFANGVRALLFDGDAMLLADDAAVATLPVAPMLAQTEAVSA